MTTFDFRNKGTNSICWTTTPYTTIGLHTLPYIEMVGYEQTWSSAIESINYWFERFKDENAGNPYKGLYLGEERNTFILPYLNEYHHAISQNWQENQGPAGQFAKKATDFATTVGKTILPAAGILFPKSYAGASPATYTFSFSLINTNKGKGEEIAENVGKNTRFLHEFVGDNLHGQNGALSVIPPNIFEVYIPGIRWSPAAVISGLTVTNKGTMNLGSTYKGFEDFYTYPDAWEIQVQVTELINESKAIWRDAITGKRADGKSMTTRVFD